jgi:enoyl-CoA hydratase
MASPPANVYDTLDIVKEGSVDIVSLNRPDRLNAMTRKMINELQAYFGGLRDDYTVRAVILRGHGRGFCAGVDLNESDKSNKNNDKAKVQKPAGGRRKESEVSKVLRGQRQLVNIFRKMREAPQPIIALLHGAATGGGFALALAADIRLATPKAKMNVAMFKMGTTGGDMGISYFLPRMVGLSIASELMLTGRFINGERALRTNLVSELYDTQEEMEVAARELAAEMLAGDENGLRLTKECLGMSVDAPSFENAVAMEDRQQVLMVVAGDWKSRVGGFAAGSSKAKARL